MGLYLKIKSTAHIRQDTVQKIVKQNFDFLTNLSTTEQKLAVEFITKYIRKDCDKVFIAYNNEEIVGLLLASFQPATDHVAKEKEKINSLSNINNKQLLKFLLNFRNLANAHKLELSERFDNMVFLDYLFVNKKYNVYEVKEFLYHNFINELKIQKINCYFCLNVDNSLFKLFRDCNYRILNEQSVMFNDPNHTQIRIQLVQCRLNNYPFNTALHQTCVNIYGTYIDTRFIYWKSYPCFDKSCKERILLIHGTASDHNTWIEIIPILRQYANVEVIDLPIHGSSNIPLYASKRWDILTLSIFVAKFIQDQNWKDLIIWGHSLGGGVTISIKQLIPDLIKGLILEDPYNSGALENTRKYILSSLKTLKIAKKDLGKNSVSIDHSKWTNALDVYRPLNKQTVYFLMSLFSKTIMNYLDWAYTNNQSPTLVCFGRDDIVINPNLSKKFFNSLGDNYQFEIIKSAGHSLHHDNPGDLLKEVCNFLETQMGLKRFND